MACVLGTLILIFPDMFGKAIMIITGIILVIEAALGIWSVIFIMRLRKKLEDEMGDSEKAIVVK